MARYQESNSESDILKSAEYEFLHKGFSGARTTEIAKRAGVTHAMLHYYFHTKEELFFKVFRQKLDLLKESVVTLFIDEDRPIMECIEEGTKRHMQFLRESPELPLFLLSEMRQNNKETENFKSMIGEELARNLAKVQKKLDAAAANGEICAIKATTLMMDILSLNMSAVMFFPAASTLTKNEMADGDSYWELRQQEIVELIKKRLTL